MLRYYSVDSSIATDYVTDDELDKRTREVPEIGNVPSIHNNLIVMHGLG